MPLTSDQFRQKGHGKTACWVDLVNSEEWDTYGERTDWLDDPTWLPFFLQQWRLNAPVGVAFPKTKFRLLRSTLRRCCEAIFADREVSEEDLHELNRTLNVPGKRQLIQRRDALHVEFVPQMQGWDWILAQIACSFANLLASGDSQRIKICQNEECRWVFYDRTKAQTRRWCSDKACGNRDRVRRARARMVR